MTTGVEEVGGGAAGGSARPSSMNAGPDLSAPGLKVVLEWASACTQGGCSAQILPFVPNKGFEGGAGVGVSLGQGSGGVQSVF